MTSFPSKSWSTERDGALTAHRTFDDVRDEGEAGRVEQAPLLKESETAAVYEIVVQLANTLAIPAGEHLKAAGCGVRLEANERAALIARWKMKEGVSG